MSELRKDKRVTKSMILSYRAPGAFIWSSSRSADISEHGVRFPSPHHLEVGMTLELKIDYSDFNEAIMVEGKVLWSREIPNTSLPYEVGLTFTKVSPVQAVKIKTITG